MLTAILAGVLALGMQQQQMDTTFAVRAGGALQLDAMNGSVTIDTWDRNAMRVQARHGRSTEIEIDRRGSDVSIDMDYRGAPQSVAFAITVPRSYSVEIDGLNLGITVDGVRGSVTLENVDGSIVVRGVTGDVDVESVSGSILIENVTGDISVESVNQAIRVNNSRGRIEAETVNGSIVMRGVDATSVEASTVNGVVEYIGTIRDDGRYFLGTHNGRITMGVPERTNARIAISTRNGRVESEFPLRMTDSSGGDFSFTLGSGSARVALESYNGTVNLVRPGGR
ncbi:MAG: DUF4097 family beta strand repeat protein [Gemmatimonadetes bacterium]|nr:DUF4097 family beta strand repeat protein [Gemmatimonadota bacterium]